MTDTEYLICNDCGWDSTTDQASDDVVETNECPHCGNELTHE